MYLIDIDQTEYTKAMMPRLFTQLFAAYLGMALVFSFSAVGQQELVEPIPTARMNPSMGLDRLVDLTAHLNQIEIEYNPTSLRNKQATVRLVEQVLPHDLWDICLSILHRNDYTIIRRPGRENFFAVVTLSAAGKSVLPTEAFERGPLTPGYQSVIRVLSSSDPIRVIASVQTLIGEKSGLSLESVPEQSAVIVSGVSEHVERALYLIGKMESEWTMPVVSYIQVEHRTPNDVITEMRSIVQKLGNHGGLQITSDLDGDAGQNAIRVIGPESEVERIREFVKVADRPSGIVTRSFDPRGYPLETVATYVQTMARDLSLRGSGDNWHVQQDELINRLILTGTQNEVDAAEDAIEQLASMPADGKRQIKMIPIKNREAAKIRELAGQLLNANMLGGTETGGETGDWQDEQRAQGEGIQLANLSSYQDIDQQRELELAVDNELNIIIASGTPRKIKQLEELIEDLDIRQPQVQLEIIMLSLSESESLDLGVELAGNIDTGDTLIGLGSLFGLSAISPSSTSAQASGTGGSAVILSPGDFSAVIRAIETVNDGRSASMPSIVVNNNETATLNSTTTQPFLTTTIQDSTTTTARGGSASAGTTITVSPQIAAGDDILLDYAISLSSFIGEASSDGVEPPTQQTSLNSIASIPDGYTIALGGIEITTEGNSDTKTPGLSSIPILGELFKSQSDSASRSRFYVFIRATVMRSTSFEHLKYLSEELTSELDIDDGWPTIEPRIIR